MKTILLTAIAFSVALATHATETIPLPPEAPIITNGTVTVTARDFEAILSRVPENLRYETRASPEKVTTMVDEVYANRVLANDAIALGLDKDPVIQHRLKQLQEAYYASLMNRHTEKTAVSGNFEARAREIYNADIDKFKEPEAVRLLYGNIEQECRTPGETEELARNIAERGKKGEDIRALADTFRLSRDAGRRRTEGISTRAQLEADVAIWAFDKLKVGEVSDPIPMRGGYVIVKLLEKRPARVIPFESVKARLIDDERVRISKAALDKRQRELQQDPGLKINRENLLALGVQIDSAALKRAHDEALRKAREGK